jgi:hypothetical protein
MSGRLIGLAGLITLWWQRFDDRHLRANCLAYAMTGGFIGFIGWQLVQGSWPCSFRPRGGHQEWHTFLTTRFW